LRNHDLTDFHSTHWKGIQLQVKVSLEWFTSLFFCFLITCCTIMSQLHVSCFLQFLPLIFRKSSQRLFFNLLSLMRIWRILFSFSTYISWPATNVIINWVSIVTLETILWRSIGLVDRKFPSKTSFSVSVKGQIVLTVSKIIFYQFFSLYISRKI